MAQQGWMDASIKNISTLSRMNQILSQKRCSSLTESSLLHVLQGNIPKVEVVNVREMEEGIGGQLLYGGIAEPHMFHVREAGERIRQQHRQRALNSVHSLLH